MDGRMDGLILSVSVFCRAGREGVRQGRRAEALDIGGDVRGGRASGVAAGGGDRDGEPGWCC